MTRVRTERCEPVVAGSLPPGTTGVNVFWTCPRCGTEHADAYGARPRVVPLADEVRLRAYFLWEAAGRPPSDGVPFWLAAERELRQATTFEMILVD